MSVPFVPLGPLSFSLWTNVTTKSKEQRVEYVGQEDVSCLAFEHNCATFFRNVWNRLPKSTASVREDLNPFTGPWR